MTDLPTVMRITGHFWCDERPRAWVQTIPAILVAVSAATLLVAHFVYTPLQVDGAWYGYPSYALSKERDPGESFAPLSTLSDLEGVRIAFSFDTRHLRTLPMAAWFKTFGESIWDAKLYSLFELTLLAGVLAYALGRCIGTTWIAALIWLLAMSDINPLTLGSTDLRPDLAIAALALSVLSLTVLERNRITWPRAVLAMLLAAALVLCHLTSAVAFSVLGGAMVVDLFMNKELRTTTRTVAYTGVLAIGFVGLLFDRAFRSLLVPSNFERPDLYYPEVAPNFDLARIAAKEARRWYDYFFDANVSILAAFLLVLLLLAFALLLRRRIPWPRLGLIIPLACGVLAGVITLALFNPHITSSHGLSVVFFAFVLLGLILVHIRLGQRPWVGICLYMILAIASVAKLALSGKVFLESRAANFSNAAIWESVNLEISDSAVDIVIGPAKLWAYLDPDQNVLILDIRADDLDRFESYMDRVDLVMIDAEYASFGFVDRLERRYPNLRTEVKSVVGDTASADYLQVLTFRVPQ